VDRGDGYRMANTWAQGVAQPIAELPGDTSQRKLTRR
jgi:hypothetical protein